MQRIVHFDLKGAPPKIKYFEEVLCHIKSWGATGVLLEWEDTFPYSSDLAHLGSETNAGGDELYNIQEVQHILSYCSQIGLEVIQLVQTIGHLEFVLKHPCHEHLRELARSPAVLCPQKQECKELVQQMIMQVLDVQPDAKYFHIGADEVWHLGYCEECSKRVTNKYPLDQWRLYLEYIRDLLLFIKRKRPDITILMWDDMLRTMCPEILQEYQLSELVQPVIWNYEVKENFRFPPGMWDLYKGCFPVVWAGSAYKGANGSSQLISPVCRYVSNHEAWREEMSRMSPHFQFSGVILTGWSRYDHFATLCELLPTSMNSLASCLKLLTIDPADSSLAIDLRRDNTLADNEWPGKVVEICVRNVTTLYEGYLRILCGDLKTTWMNSWQLEIGFLNTIQLDNIDTFIFTMTLELKMQEKIAKKELNAIYGFRTCSEWMHTHIGTMTEGFDAARRTITDVRRRDKILLPTPSPTKTPEQSDETNRAHSV